MIQVTLVSAVQPGRCLELLTCLDLISANDVEIEHHIGFLSDVTDQTRRCRSRIAATTKVGEWTIPLQS
jgi:hypothetical protein